MSTKISSLCWELDMPPTKKIVLISLADQANDDGYCCQTIGSLMRRTCLSERSVQKALAWLEASGALRRQIRSGRPSVYTPTPESYTKQAACALSEESA